MSINRHFLVSLDTQVIVNWMKFNKIPPSFASDRCEHLNRADGAAMYAVHAYVEFIIDFGSRLPRYIFENLLRSSETFPFRNGETIEPINRVVSLE